MSWRLLNKPKTVKVTKKLALDHSELTPAPHDRPLSERRLEIYRKVAREGGFRPVSWATALCLEDSEVYRVNGKHTSTMLANWTGEDIPDFLAVVEEYECDTIEDVAKLYATFDSTTQSRTARDIYLTFAGTVPELANLPVNHISTAVSGMDLHQNRGVPTGGRRQAADRAELLLEHPEFVVWASEILSGGQDNLGGSKDKRREVKHLRRSAVVGAMWATWLKAKGAATEFWTLVRDETGATPNTPDRKLARYLLTTGADKSRNRAKVASPREMYAKCLHAWNAWRKGEGTNLNYYPEADVPAAR
jgi:hypothetical protein